MGDSTNGGGPSQTPEDLRELARRIQEEMDPGKMIELVRQLITRFDETQLRKAQLRNPNLAGADSKLAGSDLADRIKA